MNISLTPEMEKLVNDKMASGRYSSASEVVGEGLRLLAEQGRLREIKLEALRKDIQEGHDSGESTPLDMDEIKRTARNRYHAPS